MNHRRPALSLPSVIDCRSEYDATPRLLLVSGGDLDWDNPYAWRIEYRCMYDGGVLDERLPGRAMAGTTESQAMIRLQKLLMGFGVLRVLVYHVRCPMTGDEVQWVKEENDELQRERAGPGYLGRGVDSPGRHSDAGRAGPMPRQNVRRPLSVGMR